MFQSVYSLSPSSALLYMNSMPCICIAVVGCWHCAATIIHKRIYLHIAGYDRQPSDGKYLKNSPVYDECIANFSVVMCSNIGATIQ